MDSSNFGKGPLRFSLFKVNIYKYAVRKIYIPVIIVVCECCTDEEEAKTPCDKMYKENLVDEFRQVSQLENNDDALAYLEDLVDDKRLNKNSEDEFSLGYDLK